MIGSKFRAGSSDHPWAEEHQHPRKPGAWPAGWNQWPELLQAFSFPQVEQSDNRIQFHHTTPFYSIWITIAEYSELRCWLPWEAALLRQQRSKPGAIDIPFANHLPLLISAYSPLWIHVRKPYPYEHLRKTEPADLEIHEVTTGASLSTGTSPTTKSIAPLNPEINPGKYEHPCQVEDLNPGGQVQPQGT